MALVKRAIDGLEVILQIVHMHEAVREAATGGDVEVADDLVDAHDALDAAAFFALGFEALCVAFAVALFDVLAFSEGPLFLGVGFADFVAGVAAAWFAGVGGWRGAAAFAAVVGVEVFVVGLFVSVCVLRYLVVR